MTRGRYSEIKCLISIKAREIQSRYLKEGIVLQQHMFRQYNCFLPGILYSRHGPHSVFEVHLRREREVREFVRPRGRHAQLSVPEVHRVRHARPLPSILAVYIVYEDTQGGV